MSATAAVCDVFKNHLATGAIKLSSDTFKIALYVAANASLDATTTGYTTTGEVSGTGYTAGGATLGAVTITQNGATLEIIWPNASWSSSTITADTALIYDSTSGDAVAVLSFSSASSTNGTFTVTLPATGIVTLT